MAVRDIERVLETLSELRNSPSPEERARELRKALGDKVNVIVAKAAVLTADLQAQTLIPDLCAAFERLMINPTKTDPKCWGKEAIAKALRDLGHVESGIFLRGAQHVQLEPVWGGQEDAATGLRATCVLALLPCSDITREDKLWPVMRLLTETSPTLRKDAALALQSLEGREAALLLRIKARMGDDDPNVAGQVFESLLQLEGEAAVPFVVGFLQAAREETREEAALALGASRLGGAVEALKDVLAQRRPFLDSKIVFRALGISRHEEAVKFLLQAIRSYRPREALAAVQALQMFRDSGEIRAQVAEAVATRSEMEIQREFQSLFGSK